MFVKGAEPGDVLEVEIVSLRPRDWGWTAIIPGFGLLAVAYIATNLGAIRHLFVRARRRPLWQLVFPVIGIAFLVFTIYKNVAGTEAPYSRFPWIVLGWLVVGGLIVALAPGVAKRIGVALTREVGDGR